MSENNKVAKAGLGYVIGNYLLKGITFLSAPIFTRLLTKAQYGDIGAYTSYETIMCIIVGLALHSSVTNAKYKYEEKFDEYVSSMVLLVGISASVWLILANLFYNQISDTLGFTRVIVNILIFHCFASAMIELFNVYVSLNYSVKSFMTITSINAITNMVLSVVLILTVFTNDRLLGRILGIATPILLISIYIIYYFFKKSKPKASLEYWKYGIVYSLPIIPHGISRIILSSFDRIMIKNMIGSDEAGLYNFSYTINSLIVVLSNSLDKVWKPWFYERMNEKDYKVIGKYGLKYVAGIGFFTSMVLMVSPEVIKILGDRDYWGTTNCAVPVILGGFFSFIYALPVLVEYFYGKTKFIAMGSMLAAGINVALNYYYIPRYGYIAAAYTTLATYFLYFTFHFILAIKIHGSSLFSPLKMYGEALCVCLVAVVAMLLEDEWYIRWGFEIIIVALTLLWAEKSFGVVTKAKKYLENRNNK